MTTPDYMDILIRKSINIDDIEKEIDRQLTMSNRVQEYANTSKATVILEKKIPTSVLQLLLDKYRQCGWKKVSAVYSCDTVVTLTFSMI